MNYKIVPTPPFEKELKHLAKKYPSLKEDFAELVEELAQNPSIGIPLGDNCYKIRMAITSKGKGKSGGARVITCVRILRQTVYLIAIYDKSDMENITDSELSRRFKPLDS